MARFLSKKGSVQRFLYIPGTRSGLGFLHRLEKIPNLTPGWTFHCVAENMTASRSCGNMPMIDEETDLTPLDAFCRSGRAPNSMGLSKLDGFLTGLVVGPAVILPSEWLPEIWGGEMPEFFDEAEAQLMLGAIMSRYSEITARLDLGPEGLEPVFRTGSDGETVIARDWAEGFFDAIELRAETWTPLIKDEKAGIFLAPILALCADEQGKTLLSADEDEQAQWRVHAPGLIPASVLAIRDFWRERAAEVLLRQPVRRGPKTGRNESCPCGSGRKHKRCCGAS